LTLRVIAFTDESVVQLGVEKLLANDPKFDLICVCSNQVELLASVKHQPHVILYAFRNDTELTAVHNLRRSAQGASIVLWSREFSSELVHRAMEIGVRGFLSTTAALETVKECLRASGIGETWMERSLSVSLLNARPVSLSRRQSQLLTLLVQGLKNKEIATALGISEGTVKAYLTTLFEKVGAKDRFELALYGMRNLGNVHEGVSDRDHRVAAQSVMSRRKTRRTVA
jgi:DNA-binding NarL/FixJ family response regulator